MNFKEIVERVREVEPSAVDALEDNFNPTIWDDPFGCDKHSCLASLFLWEDTPQGYDFWKDLNNKVFGE